MSELLKYIRNLFGLGLSDDRQIHQNRKRRLIQEEFESYSSKFRKLNEFNMNYNNYRSDRSSDDWTDLPSTSKSTFSKYFTTRRNPIRPTMRLLNSEVIDLSDDDDIIEVTPRKPGLLNGNSSSSTSSMSIKNRSTSPQNILFEAKRTIKNCNRLLKNNLSETIRLDEQQVYHDMLLNSPRTSAVYSNGTVTSTPNNSRAKKILSLLNDKRNFPIIDLTDEKKKDETIVIKDSDSEVDSVGSKRKIEPVNSLKKILDTEPFMNPNYLSKLDEQRQQKKKEVERLIHETKLKRDKFSDINRENYNLLLELKVKNCKLTDVVLLDEYSNDEELAFPDFSSEQESKINEALKSRNPNRVFVDKYNLRITGQDLKLFNEKEWLNDEVINFYVNMIQERSERKDLPKVYSFSTFFYPKLLASGYSSLRRWTKRVDIFAKDLIIVPIHLGFHWCMAIIDFRDKSIRYYDSMLGKNIQCLNALEAYLKEEHKDKKKSDYDTSDWRKVIMKDIPRQMNGSDCGVFSCTFAEFISRNAKILFTQEHMPYIRRKMVIEIIEGALLT